MSKAFDKSRVSPFLFDVKRSEVQGPILQFQSTIFNKKDVLKLLQSLNKAMDKEALQDDRVKKGFDVWWPELEKKLNEIDSETPSEVIKDHKTEKKDLVSASADILEEILDLVRNQQKKLNSPESLLPPAYMDSLIGRFEGISDSHDELFNHPVWVELYLRFDKLFNIISSHDPEEPISPEKIMPLMLGMSDMLAYIRKEFMKKPNKLIARMQLVSRK